MTQTIEQLTARVRELEEENARLKAAVEYAETIRVENIAYFEKQLATSQLREAQLRDLLANAIQFQDSYYRYADAIAEALAQPSDTSALDAYVAGKVKGKTDALHYRMEHCYSIDHVKIQCELDQMTKQRDLAVEALEITVNSWSEQFERHGHLAPEWAVKCRNAISTIKEIEGNG
jgi:hypothetical protein